MKDKLVMYDFLKDCCKELHYLIIAKDKSFLDTLSDPIIKGRHCVSVGIDAFESYDFELVKSTAKKIYNEIVEFNEELTPISFSTCEDLYERGCSVVDYAGVTLSAKYIEELNTVRLFTQGDFKWVE